MLWRLTILGICLTCFALAAQPQSQQQPQIRLNVLNVCTPGDVETSEISAALARVPAQPSFAPDFEVSRGRTTSPGQPASRWVRLRRDLNGPALATVQYLFSIAGAVVDETVVFHTRDTKPGEPLQITLENQVTARTPAEVLAADTPPGRIRVERFGKPSLVLARCADADQRKYEPLFGIAAERFARYRAALDVRATVSAELTRIRAAGKPSASR